MKLTEKQKIEICQKRKQGTPIPCLSLEYGINKSGIKYLVCLIDAHGLDIVKHDYHRYTPEFKLNAINRVLINQESINLVSINLGLSNIGTLPRWIKEYTENGYTVVAKKTDNLQAENKALKEENAKLRRQNEILMIQQEYLKKLDALVTAREKREKQK